MDNYSIISLGDRLFILVGWVIYGDESGKNISGLWSSEKCWGGGIKCLVGTFVEIVFCITFVEQRPTK